MSFKKKLLISKEMVEKTRKISYPDDSNEELFNHLWHKNIIRFSWSKFQKDIHKHRKYFNGDDSIYDLTNKKHEIKRDFYKAVFHIRHNCQYFFKSKLMDHTNDDKQGHVTVKVYYTLLSKDNSTKIVVNNSIENKNIDINSISSL